ncbi:hypothetical protein ACLECU_01730 [Lonsdalea quercina]|uniref:hypothetical protein n=1 Tax=Lonsdalea quercina TaxID=71657 RepID=UPI00397702C3
MPMKFLARYIAAAMLLTMPVMGQTQDANADMIEGYTSQELASALPDKVNDLIRRSLNTDATNHIIDAEYIEATTNRKALISLYTLPVNVSGETPFADKEDDVDAVIASAEKEMLRQRIQPEKRTLTSSNGSTIRCLQTMLNKQVLHSLCATYIQGRIMEVQPVTFTDTAVLPDAVAAQDKLVLEISDKMHALPAK